MADKVKDPVCGMMIRPEDAAAPEEHEGAPAPDPTIGIPPTGDDGH